MPFLSSFGGATAIGFGFSHSEGGGGPYTGTLYYYEGADETDTTSTWATLGKWYKNNSHNQAATDLPSVANATVLLNNTSADLETWTAPASINISGKSLTLSAHALSSGCASAKEFSTTVTANSSSNLILSGHILVTGVNHQLSTYNSGTSYYFDSTIAVDSYIYQNQYSDLVAAVALVFVAELAGDFYTITTNNSGKVISKVSYSIDPPAGPDVSNRDLEHESRIDPIIKFSKYRGYSTKFAIDTCPTEGESGMINAAGIGFKLLTPTDMTTASKDPVYLVATRNEEDNSLTYLTDPNPYTGDLVYLYTQGPDVFKKVTTNMYGYITAVVTCE